MSNYPNGYDDDSTLPAVNDNLTEIGGDAINALRDAVMQIELALGTNIAGTQPSLAARLGILINPDGSPNTSTINSLGLVTLPVRNDQIAENAGIPESKLKLDFRTQDLFNYIRDLSLDVNTVTGWISVSGIKLEPHLIGAIYRHTMNQIDVSVLPSEFLQGNARVLRDNSQSYALVNDINNELLAHQWADGSPFGNIYNITTNNGSVYRSNYGHTASGIFINTSRFLTVPQTADDLQLFADFIDGAGIFLLGTRIQNLYANGISRVSRSSSLLADGYGQPLVPVTPAVAYLKHLGNNSSPFDDIDTGDDIVEFKPASADIADNSFDAKFALVKPGDIVRVNYGTVEVPFIIREKKYVPTVGNKRYVVRIAGKNLSYSTNAIARIDKPLVNNNKYGVLAIAPANNLFSETPSLIVASPRGAQAFGLGFSPDDFDETHYLLYLALYPTGNPADGYTFLPAIDVTGNQGITPGLYTLDSIVEATNAAFRKVGYNYRFVAFSKDGEFGIALADSYNNTGFSIINGVVSPGGVFSQAETEFYFPNNVIDLFPPVGSTVAPDPLGFGLYGANVGSPPYLTAYGSEAASQYPTKLFVPLSRNNYYVDGAERERLSIEIGQVLDQFGDGYWVAEIVEPPGAPPSGRVETTYRIPLDLSASTLKAGKTLVVQSLGQGSLVDFGRFFIKSIAFGCNPTNFTDITVYDAVHAKGFSPTTTLGVDGYVAIYFNSDSVSFNSESATDYSTVSAFKRHFEVYVDANSNTFTQERGRMLINANSLLVNGVTLLSTTELAKLDLVKISPKLRGYQFGSVNKITLNIIDYNDTTGIFNGNLASYDGITFTHAGPVTYGKKGEVTRFYDETYIDYIDVIFDVNTPVSDFSNKNLDIQLFPTLSLDNQIMMIGTCQLNDSLKSISRIRDERQFGNVSENELTTSALNFIALPEKLLHFNGVVRGFDIVTVSNEVITLNGGVALVSGKLQFINNQTFSVPKVAELYNFSTYSINWVLCVNSVGELVVLPLTDSELPYTPLGAPINRVMTVSNRVTLNTYAIDSSDFKTILDSRKDLTMLYIVRSTITGSGSGATVTLVNKDIRRFINDQDSSIVPTVSAYNTQSNFKNINTALNWLQFSNAMQSNLSVKGAHIVTSAYSNTSGQMHVYPGGSGSSLTFNSTLNITNFRFTDLPIVTGQGATLTNVIAQNCPFTINGILTANGVDFSKSTGTSITGTVNATNSSFVDGSLILASSGTFTSCRLNNHSTFNISDAAIFTSCRMDDITSFQALATGSFTGTRIHNVPTFSVSSNGTFNNCTVDDIGTFTVGGTGSFTNCELRNYTSFSTATGIFNHCRLQDVPTLTISGNSTWSNNSTINNIGTLNITGTGSFSNTFTNNVTTCTLGGGGSWSSNCVIENVSSLTMATTGTFTNSIVNKIPLLTIGSNGSFSSNFVVENIANLGIGGSVNFSNGVIKNVPAITVGSGATFNTASVNGVHGSVTGAVTFTSCEVFDSDLNATTNWTATNSDFRDYTATVSAIFSATNCTFVNCNITVGTTATIDGCRFKNCTINITSTSSVLNTNYFEQCTVVFTGAATLNASGNNTILFRDCTLTFTNGGTFTNVVIDPSTVTIGNTITTTNVTVIDSTVSVSAVRAFTLSNNFKFARNTVTWTGAPAGGYDPDNIVNSGNGLLFASVGNSTLENITVDDNIFNYALSDRFPFFSIQLTNLAAVARNISVCRNKFLSTSLSEDIRAVIAIVSTLLARAALGVFPQFPLLTDVHLDDNVCNYNQLIIISGTKDPVGAMNGANPVVINTTISRNTCGTIGYFIGSAGPFDGNNVSNPNNGIVRDKVNKLVIDSNYCRFIANLDHKGDYICFRATRYPFANVAEEVSSTVGDSLISNNTCNWIQVGVGGYTIGPSICEILNNSVSPFNSNFLNNYTSQTTYQSITPGNVGILVRRPHNATDLAAASVISGNELIQKNTTTASPGVTITNTTNASPIVVTTSSAHGFATGQLVSISGVTGNTAANGSWIITVTGTNTFSLNGSVGNFASSSGGVAVSTNVYYYDAAIASFNNTRITNNRISGVVNSDDSPLIYLWNVFKSAIISDNILERRGLNCKAFIWFDRFDSGKNTLDSIFVSDNLLDDVKFTSGQLDRAFLSFTDYNTNFEKGVVIMNNMVQTSTGGNVYEVRYTNGKSTIIAIP